MMRQRGFFVGRPGGLPPAGRSPLAFGSQLGFTLLEVMVAVAILGLGLTAILSAQFSAVSATAHAKNLSVSTGLARCKMSEVEDHLRIEGFPEIDLEESGPCCEGDTTPNVVCTWSVAKPTFPEANYGDLDLDADLDDTALGALTGENSPLSGATNVGDMTSLLAGGQSNLGALASGGIGGVTSMVMGIVYPSLKTVFEASARRITVVLTWAEGDRRYDIVLEQWVTQPQPGMAAAGALMGGSGGGTPGGPTPPGGGPTGPGIPGGRQPPMGKSPLGGGR
jgi:general secretion pathway protein I